MEDALRRATDAREQVHVKLRAFRKRSCIYLSGIYEALIMVQEEVTRSICVFGRIS